MGTIVISTNVSLDGVVQDPDGSEGLELGGWFAEFGGKDLEPWGKVMFDEAMRAEALLLGRRTDEWFGSRWNERPGEWAAVVFWHSLEHLREPRAALRRACSLLAPSGLLIVAVPNRASWQARWLGNRWLALDLPRHLVHLSAGALVDGVRECGLEVDRVS